jgi:site-specific recombinase XerD
MHIELLLEDFCHYSKYIKGVSKDTEKRYRENVSYFAKASKISLISDVSEQTVQTFFLHGRKDKQWKISTYRTYYMSLVVFFRWCVKNKYLDVNYLDDFELPKLEKSLPKKIKKEEALRLLEIAYNYPYTQKYLKYRNHAIFALFLFAGLRKNELLQMKLTDIDKAMRI